MNRLKKLGVFLFIGVPVIAIYFIGKTIASLGAVIMNSAKYMDVEFHKAHKEK